VFFCFTAGGNVYGCQVGFDGAAAAAQEKHRQLLFFLDLLFLEFL